ncbi:MAG TPA: AMP-binding protein [Sphingobium sp.]|uniref:AMP-binding protein n=1 Tax=Sphingobium sp. TaxID=1912891 RepID=UPI002ED50171
MNSQHDVETSQMGGRRLVEGRSIRWDDVQAETAYSMGLWVRETLGDSLRAVAAGDPGRVLVEEGDKRVTAAHLLQRSTQLAGTMLARMATGSVISFMLPNWHEAAEIYLAATLAGMVVNPILPSLRDHDLAFLLTDSGSRMIFIPETFRGYSYRAMLERVTDGVDAPPDVVVLRGDAGPHEGYASLFDRIGKHELPQVEPDAVRMIMYTSGTTGTPKAVLHSHNSLHALIRQIGDHWHIAPGDRFLVPSPISHIGGSIYTFETPLLLGSSVILMDHWRAEDALEIMADRHVTHMAGATPFLEQLLAAARKKAIKLPDLKVFICGGASVPPSLIREAAAYFENTAVTRAYGSTEVPVTAVGAANRHDIAHAADTDGKIGIATVRIAGDGEILAKGPQMLVGYLHRDHEAAAFDEEGFYRTGDTGRIIDGDYLVIEGRKKDIIIRMGENIAPKEIEDLLIQHPAIAEVAIVGLPHPRTGEQACAVVVAAAEDDLQLVDMVSFLDALGVAKFKFPETLVLWPSLPKNDAGKVLKHRIRERILAEQGPPE